MEIIGLSIVNCKIIEHCFDGLFGVEDFDTPTDDRRGIIVQFTDRTKVFDHYGTEIDAEKYFKDVKDGLWVWINKTRESEGRLWKILYPTTRVFYLLNGEKFAFDHEVSLDDADTLLDPEKEYVGSLSVKLHERKVHKDESDKYVVYATRIIIRELEKD